MADSGLRPRLNTWKEIAAFLGKGVRTAQRWETEFGLPVRRIGRGHGEIVYAFLDELEAWRQSAEAEAARSLVQEPGPSDPATIGSRSPLRKLAAGGVLVVVVAAALVLARTQRWGRASSPGIRQPAVVRIEPDGLAALDDDGAPLWRHRFPFPLRPGGYDAAALGLGTLFRLTATEDIDGDGRREVLVDVLADDEANQGLYAFEADGRLRFVHRVGGSVAFGATTFRSPFLPHGFATTAAPGGGRLIWASSVHHGLFPCVLHRLDSAGRITGEYWSNGYINTVTAGRLGDREVVVVGATNNEHRATSLAVLDAADPSGAAPAALEKYRCTSCPAKAPLAFAVFPKAPRFAGTPGGGKVSHVILEGGDGLAVGTAHAFAGSENRQAAVALYHLDADLCPIAVDVSDHWTTVHEQLVKARQAPALGWAPPQDELLPILRWHGSAFVAAGFGCLSE